MAVEGRARGVEIFTATMLGLVSLVTAIGAWQAGSLTNAADEFGRDSGDARDVSVTEYVLSDYARRMDQEASVEARSAQQQREQATDEIERLYYETRVKGILARATPGFDLAWREWEESGFADSANPMNNPDYLAARDGFPASYAYVATVAKSLEDATRSKAVVLARRRSSRRSPCSCSA